MTLVIHGGEDQKWKARGNDGVTTPENHLSPWRRGFDILGEAFGGVRKELGI
jgi:hypothetical protein